MSEMKKTGITQSQKMMVFILTMSLYGMATLFTELIPKFQIGIVEFSVEYFLFIPFTLAILFDPLSAALGAATGELVFSEIMLGKFGGLSELEKFITVTIGVYIVGRMIRNPKNIKMVAFASIIGVSIQQILGAIVDILKVSFAVEDFEAVSGLPESVFFTEGFACLNDILFSGILFCMIPTMYLVPRLYGKIEPLLGVKPRDLNTVFEKDRIFTPKRVLIIVLAFVGAVLGEFLAEGGINFIDWEADWAETNVAMGFSFIVAALIVGVIVTVIIKKKNVETL